VEGIMCPDKALSHVGGGEPPGRPNLVGMVEAERKGEM